MTPEKLNLVFIVVDAGRRDRFGCYGYARGTTPEIDKLARQSTVFDRMIAPAPWTLPSHASLFTGLYSREHGADRPALKMRTGLVTLGEYLQRHGYASVFVSNNPLVSRRWGILDEASQVLLRRDFDRDYRRGVGTKWARRVKTLLGAFDKGARATNHLVKDLLSTLHSPFFLFINYMECHWSYTPPRSFERRFVRRPYSVAQSAFHRVRMRRRRSWEPVPADNQEELGLLSDLYDASLAYVDSRVGELLEILDRDGRADDTVVIITADHGENLGDHGLIGHGMHLYQTLLHVPFLARIPGRSPARIEGLVQLTDVFPGLCGLLGVGAPAHLVDRRFAVNPFALAPGERGRPFAFAEWHQWEAERLQKRLRKFPRFRSTPSMEAVQDEQFKLIVEPASGTELLFDLQADPGELHNQVDRAPEVKARLRGALEQWRSIFLPVGEAVSYTPEEERALEARLAELGYI